MIEDGRLTELLSEADDLSDRDPEAAARNLREVVLPRARSNQGAAGAVAPRHARAQALARELRRLTDERVATVEAYAQALQSRDLAAQREVIHRQVALENSVHQLQDDIDRASREPASGGCAVAMAGAGR
jgi:hypothetical protein